MVIYGISQGKGQLNIIMNARTIEEVMQDPTFPDSLKHKLTLVTEIKKFAVDSIGISPSENYTTVFDQHGKAILWTLSAAEPYEMKAKEWTFPFLGSVSYKGFFNKTALRKEYLALVKDDYDIDIYSPSGWSTLGWFQDPILSGMLKKDPGTLSNLIIHELTHGTLYVKNDVTFNENLANFIGDKGAELFLANRFGKNSKEYKEYEESKEDDLIYNKYILESTGKLKSLYRSFTPTETDSSRYHKKMDLIAEIVMGVNKLKLHRKKQLFKYTLQAFKEGNAFFMSFERYDSEYSTFENEFRKYFNSDLRSYLKAMKTKYPSL
jgi:predicted aminopeptidase